MRYIFIITILSFFANHSFAQDNGIKIGSNLPVFAGIGGEQHFADKISLQAKVGYIPPIFSKLFLEYGNMSNLDTAKVSFMQNTTHGFAFDMGANYNFEKNYIGFYGQFLAFGLEMTPQTLLNTFYERQEFIDEMRNRLRDGYTSEGFVKSQLFAGGVVYGHRFKLKKEGWSIILEASFSKVMFSKTKILMDDKSAEVTLNNYVSSDYYEQMTEIYRKSYLPSINIYVMYYISPDPHWQRRQTLNRNRRIPTW